MDMTRSRRLAERWWPAPIAAIVFLANLLTRFGEPLLMLAILVLCLALAVARVVPLQAFCVAALGAVLAPLAGETSTGWVLLAFALAVGLLASWGVEPLRWRLLLGIPVAATAAAALILLGLRAEASIGSSSVASWAAGYAWAFAVVAWAAVVGARALRDYLRVESAKQQAVARTTVVESELRDERLRADLTHDFHDVMAHSLAVLAAQAEGLRLSHRQHPERIDPVLTTISDTARLALVEVRQLLERVDEDDRRPQATSADIPGLVAQLRSAGPTVALQDVGTHGHLARVADIAAYRIVQESLTNALRHGGADVEVSVSLTWTGPGLTIVVSSPIRDRAALRPAGRGIAGMLERARLAGGSLEVDAEGDRFVVSAHLPYSPVSDAPTPPLSEDQLATLPVPVQRRPEDVVAPWIVEASRRYEQRHPRQPAADWSQATTVDLTPVPPSDGRVTNPMPGPDAAPRPDVAPEPERA
ncbi:sensor histidine kinase [Agrococcus jenensis]|uniref:histidine kinase n=1 Tax=Agrococcus jenensis TaxID=46353 RepID=A0A3N2APW6_9MICO|nr:histidine kinase [Agrococcus jenensis]ROR65070.1 signal transduction histidine kinase [Agrococcus jenensis]